MKYSIIIEILASIFLCSAAGYLLKPQPAHVVIGFGGDTMLGRLVDQAIEQYGYAYPWGNLLPVLQKTDFNIVNLETTLTKSTKLVPKTFNFKSLPDHVQCLPLANIAIVNIANNHALDFNCEGLQETLQTLDAANIAHVGAGINATQAAAPVLMKKNGLRIGVLGFSDYPAEWAATAHTPGINYIDLTNPIPATTAITQLAQHADLVIVSIHWGPNFSEAPTKRIIDCAHAFIDAGADIVHGHSAHIFHGIERYCNKLIMYDTGELVDDYAIDSKKRNDLSIFVTVTASRHHIDDVAITPIIINNMQTNSAMQPDYAWVKHRLNTLSAPLSKNVNVSLLTGEMNGYHF